jgi:hypothetical protein
MISTSKPLITRVRASPSMTMSDRHCPVFRAHICPEVWPWYAEIRIEEEATPLTDQDSVLISKSRKVQLAVVCSTSFDFRVSNRRRRSALVEPCLRTRLVRDPSPGRTDQKRFDAYCL